MSTPDQRLRERLERVTASVEPDVDRHLHRSLLRGRRRQVARRVGIAAGTLAAIAIVVLAGQRILERSDDRIPAGTPTPTTATTSAPADITLDGAWTAAVTRADVEAALAGGGLETWTDQLIDDLGGAEPLDVELTIEGGAYTLSVDGETINGGDAEVRGTELVLTLDPNGVTVLDAAVDGDVVTFTFVSNATQPYPPDMVPEEAVQRALFTAAPFSRS